MKILLIALLAVPVQAAVNSPLESDFPAGYWERESMVYGSAMTGYSLSVASKDPAALRGQIEEMCKTEGAVLTGFSDQTPYLTAGNSGITAYPAPYGALQARPRQAYSLTYKLSLPKAGELARKMADMGRLLSYATQTPYAVSQLKELDDKIEWIEREQKQSADSLRSMPVSRALLDARLKVLKQSRDSAKANEGTASITVQIMLDEAEKPEEAREPRRPAKRGKR